MPTFISFNRSSRVAGKLFNITSTKFIGIDNTGSNFTTTAVAFGCMAGESFTVTGANSMNDTVGNRSLRHHQRNHTQGHDYHYRNLHLPFSREELMLLVDISFQKRVRLISGGLGY